MSYVCVDASTGSIFWGHAACLSLSAWCMQPSSAAALKKNQCAVLGSVIISHILHQTHKARSHHFLPHPVGIIHSMLLPILQLTEEWKIHQREHSWRSFDLPAPSQQCTSSPPPPPPPPYPCCLPWTVILKRRDIDRHINQRLSVALPPMPRSSKLAELQLLSDSGRESHVSFQLLDHRSNSPHIHPPRVFRPLTFD